MSNKMLIDASHTEETRVVVMRGDRVEEFDFESALRKQLRGNIYLAKVTRVEPSLQAAFVDYGGNRHGFLAFNEIHPDYYQLPQADREALLQVEAAEARDAAKRDLEADGVDDDLDKSSSSDDDDDDTDQSESSELDAPEVEVGDDEGGSIESVGSEDALEELPVRHSLQRKHYKIQEVIKRRQIILIQVVKEERGNKGAALTTYLSLAGRYTVLMPNTARGGGISRKIANPADRKRLRKIVEELEVPAGMGLIVRTAGASRTKAELKRDFEYLLRLWENVRDLTLQSAAPSLVYEEGNLIKRSIRDLYTKEVEEVLVSGEEEYREAKDFMRMLMPSHAKNVQPYKQSEPLFARYKIEAQLNAMYSPYVTLPSGGYIVINQTEALVSVDVNSGRATKEHSIEDTALKTNLEASTEISRQLRLRDLAGLVVIDFIDMEERRNNRAVERRIKECLRHDRARIQVGRISHFGLLEMSRQRLRTGVLEGSTSQCPHCQGTGMIRSTESMALTILRALEDRLQSQRQTLDLICHTNVDVALYILNNKRNYVHDIENRYRVNISIEASQSLEGVSYTIENSARNEQASSKDSSVIQMDWAHKSVDSETSPIEDSGEEEDAKPRRKRRRRRGGQTTRQNRESHNRDSQDQNSETESDHSLETQAQDQTDTVTDAGVDGAEAKEDRPSRPRRRGRRGGRRRGNRSEHEENNETNVQETSSGRDEQSASQDQQTSDLVQNSDRVQDSDRAQDSDRTQDSERPPSEEDAKPARRTGRTRRTSRTRRPRTSVKPRDADLSTNDNKAPVTQKTDGNADDKPATSGQPVKDQSADTPSTKKAPSTNKAPAKRADKEQEKSNAPSSLVASDGSTEETTGSPRRGWWQKRSG